MTSDTPRELLLDQVDSLRAQKRWNREQLRQEAADILGREEPVGVEELPEEDLVRLIAAWEPVYLGAKVAVTA